MQSSDAFAKAIGYPRAPVDDLLVFHIVFGKTVPDISLNAVANLGYAGMPFPGAGLSGRHARAPSSEVIGLKENSNRKTGIVYVRTPRRQPGRRQPVLDYVRWVMVRKRDEAAPAPADQCRDCRPRSSRSARRAPARRSTSPAYDFALAGSPHRFGDYAVGEKIDHVDGMTVEEAEHQIATRLYQNTARVHFNQFIDGAGPLRQRLIYGGHVISLARALSFNGLANAFHIAAINGGRHVAPLFAGDTVFAWSEVLEASELPGRDDVGALRLRTVATKDRPCADFPDKNGEEYDPAVSARSRLLGADAAVSAVIYFARRTAAPSRPRRRFAGSRRRRCGRRRCRPDRSCNRPPWRGSRATSRHCRTRVRLALLQRDRRVDDLDRKLAALRHMQVRHVAGMALAGQDAVLVVAGIEMRAGGLERRFAFADGVDVERVLAGRQALDLQLDQDAGRGLHQVDVAHGLAAANP